MIQTEADRGLVEQVAKYWGFIPSSPDIYEPIYAKISEEIRYYDDQFLMVVTRKDFTSRGIDVKRMHRYLGLLKSPFIMRSGSMLTLVTEKFFDYDHNEPHIEYRRFGNEYPTRLPVQAFGIYFSDGTSPLEIIYGDANVFKWAECNNQREPFMEMQLGLKVIKFLP